ncbi:hypothetical protein LY76DRAFT_516190, partial [Colletotrichum caudatum]
LWRRNPEDQPICDACGLYLRLRGVARPPSLKTDDIQKTSRGSSTSLPTDKSQSSAAAAAASYANEFSGSGKS